ncbi:MAG: Iron-sulfur cluster insertion protein ErpA [Candidatus Heimdallarchaeota archaeon LC_2]|nr:MAG: Iron-sulfur cluster insertion protein ErpA [Candidatus Heimdallarchaeota archaeon LC_2]
MVELSLNFNIPKGAFKITEAAATRIKELIELDGRSNSALEIKIVPGGCAGFSYEMGWAPITKDGKKFERDGAAVIIAETDMRLLDNAELDYVSSLMGSKFDIINPNSSSSCGCGKSWS